MAAAWVQDKSNGQSGVASIAATFDSNVTAGNAIVVMVRTADETVLTISDSQGNTYNNITLDTSQFYTGIWVALNCAGGATTVTTTRASGTARTGIAIAEASGVATSGAVDKSTDAKGFSANPSSGATAALAQADQIVFGGLSYAGTQTVTVGDGYEHLEYNDTGKVGIECKVVSATDAVTATFTISDGTQGWYCGVVTLKAAAAGGSILRQMLAHHGG